MMAGSLIVAPVSAAPAGGSLEAQKAAAESEADALQQELVSLLDKMGQLEEDLILKGEEIQQAEEDLTDAKEQEEEQYEAMKLRIKYMYEEGMTTALEALVSAENFTDFLNKAAYVADVHTYDRTKLQEYEKTRQEIEDIQVQLKKDQESMEEMQSEYEEEEASLTATLEEKKDEIANFDEQIQAAAEAAAREAAEREESQSQTETAAQGGAAGGSSADSSAGSGSSTGSQTSNAGGTGSTGSAGGGAQTGNTSVAQTIVNAAYSQRGVPYVYGGTGGNGGWDCSGLVQYCHRQAGINLPRTSEAQGGCGISVTNPQPGDIVCYGSHVGIYIGNNQMIHAPKPGQCVKVATVYGSPWYRRCW